jgi:hypothetical protein
MSTQGSGRVRSDAAMLAFARVVTVAALVPLGPSSAEHRSRAAPQDGHEPLQLTRNYAGMSPLRRALRPLAHASLTGHARIDLAAAGMFACRGSTQTPRAGHGAMNKR